MPGWYNVNRWWRQVTEQGPAGKVSSIVSIAFITVHACIGLLCAFAPLSIASSQAVARYAEVLTSLVPSIGAFTRISSFPSHTQLTLVVLWTCVPISALIVARVPWFWIPDMTRLRRSPWALILFTLTLGLIVLMALRLEVDVATLSERSRGARLFTAMSNFRILLGVVGGLICAARGAVRWIFMPDTGRGPGSFARRFSLTHTVQTIDHSDFTVRHPRPQTLDTEPFTMKSNDDRYWFPAKRYGWGWGLARCWQGLLVQGGYVALIIASASFLLPLRRKTFWIVFAVSTALLLLIHWLKGEKLAWRWGKP